MSSVATGALAEVGDAPGHVVSTAPFDPTSAVRLTAEQEHFYLASQWTLMWWKFKRHRVAVVSGVILLLMYASTLVSEILVPYSSRANRSRPSSSVPSQYFCEGGELIASRDCSEYEYGAR